MNDRRTYDRRTFLIYSSRALGGAALLSSVPFIASCGSDADDSGAGADGTPVLGTVRTQFNWVPDIEWAAWYLADAKGFFARHRARVTLNHGGPNTPSPIQILAGGGGDVGSTSTEFEIITANAQGADYVALAAMYQRGPLGFAWLSKTPISSAKDLVGKRIGAPQGRQPTIDAVFKVNELPVDYEYVPMSFDPQPLVDGEMDVITAYVTNQPVQLELKGVDVSAKPLSDFGLASYGDIIFAERAYVEANRGLLVGYLAGLVEGVKANMADPAEVIPLLLDVYGADAEINEDYSRIGNRRYIELMESEYTDSHGLLSIDPTRLEADVWPGYAAAGATELPDPKAFVDTSLLAEAHARL